MPESAIGLNVSYRNLVFRIIFPAPFLALALHRSEAAHRL
jgi:hypothetical protein